MLAIQAKSWGSHCLRGLAFRFACLLGQLGPEHTTSVSLTAEHTPSNCHAFALHPVPQSPAYGGDRRSTEVEARGHLLLVQDFCDQGSLQVSSWASPWGKAGSGEHYEVALVRTTACPACSPGAMTCRLMSIALPFA